MRTLACFAGFEPSPTFDGTPGRWCVHCGGMRDEHERSYRGRHLRVRRRLQPNAPPLFSSARSFQDGGVYRTVYIRADGEWLTRVAEIREPRETEG